MGRCSSSSRPRKPSSSYIEIFNEVELLKVTATRSDLERFNRNVMKIKERYDLDMTADLVIPDTRSIQKQQRSTKDSDLLDYVFSDKIPFLHDLLMTGEVESEYIQLEGSHEVVNAFNRLVDQMIYEKELNVTIRVAERRKIVVDRIVSEEAMNNIDTIMDSIFTVDFSKSMPALHNAIVS